MGRLGRTENPSDLSTRDDGDALGFSLRYQSNLFRHGKTVDARAISLDAIGIPYVVRQLGYNRASHPPTEATL
jgi:hypothetical protein